MKAISILPAGKFDLSVLLFVICGHATLFGQGAAKNNFVGLWEIKFDGKIKQLSMYDSGLGVVVGPTEPVFPWDHLFLGQVLRGEPTTMSGTFYERDGNQFGVFRFTLNHTIIGEGEKKVFQYEMDNLEGEIVYTNHRYQQKGFPKCFAVTGTRKGDPVEPPGHKTGNKLTVEYPPNTVGGSWKITWFDGDYELSEPYLPTELYLAANEKHVDNWGVLGVIPDHEKEQFRSQVWLVNQTPQFHEHSLLSQHRIPCFGVWYDWKGKNGGGFSLSLDGTKSIQGEFFTQDDGVFGTPGLRRLRLKGVRTE